MTLNPEAVSHLRPSSITQLTLYHCQVQEFDLDSLLAASPSLRYLEYHALVDYRWYTTHWNRSRMSRSLGLEPLFGALHHVRHTLTELVTSQKFDMDSHYFEQSFAAGQEAPFRHVYELSKMKYLHTLVIPYASLLGWEEKDWKIFDWHRIMPPSLHNVTFTDKLSENFASIGWEDQSLMPVFSDLASWLATHARGDHLPKFTLRLLQTDTEFNKAARQELSRIFEKHGVLCTVEKLLKDRIDHSPRMPRGAFGGRGRGRGRGRGL